jgi:hypothetical protein
VRRKSFCTPDIFNCGSRRSEVDDDVDAAEVGRGEGRRVFILVDVECTYAVTALASNFGDERAGLSLTQNEKKHSLAPGC